MKYKATAAYQRLMPDGEKVNDVRSVGGEWFLESVSTEVEEAYVRSKARARVIDEVVALHNYVPRSIANVQVEIIKEAPATAGRSGDVQQ